MTRMHELKNSTFQNLYKQHETKENFIETSIRMSNFIKTKNGKTEIQSFIPENLNDNMVNKNFINFYNRYQYIKSTTEQQVYNMDLYNDPYILNGNIFQKYDYDEQNYYKDDIKQDQLQIEHLYTVFSSTYTKKLENSSIEFLYSSNIDQNMFVMKFVFPLRTYINNIEFYNNDTLVYNQTNFEQYSLLGIIPFSIDRDISYNKIIIRFKTNIQFSGLNKELLFVLKSFEQYKVNRPSNYKVHYNNIEDIDNMYNYNTHFTIDAGELVNDKYPDYLIVPNIIYSGDIA